MKLWTASLTAVLALNGASAQLFSPESIQYSLLGAFIGGVAGGNNHYHCGYYGWSGEGAAIGAGIGLVAGTLIGETRRQQYASAPYAYPATPGYGYAPAPLRPNYAVSGTLIGAASGALIGQGAGDKPGQGAAIGAAAGLVLGSVAEHSARKHESAPAGLGQTAPAATPGKVAPGTIRQRAPAPRHQVPDAPRVPDAPTF